MSRSYKKPWIKDRCKGERNRAARAIRRLPWEVEVPDGKAYRKFYNSWNISDWCFAITHPDQKCSWNSFINSLYLGRPELLRQDREERLNRWVRHCGNGRAHRKRVPNGKTFLL